MPKVLFIDREQFEALKKELIRVSGIDLTLDKAYVTLSEYIKKQSELYFPPKKFDDGKIIQQQETISVDTLRRYWGDKDANKNITPTILESCPLWHVH